VTTETLPPGATEPVRTNRRFIVVVVGVLVGLLIVTLGIIGWRSYRHPGVFYPVSDSPDSYGAGSVHTPETWGMSYAYKDVDPAEVSIVHATPNVLMNTAKATILVRVCTIDRTAGVGAIGSVINIRSECSRLAPPDGATMKLGDFADQLVVTIVPTQPGTVLVKGLHVTYSHGWKRGPEDIGMFLRYRAR